MLFQHQADFDKMAPEVIEYETIGTEKECDILLIAHGIVARAATTATNDMRAQGMNIGFFRPITLRPFPVEELRTAAGKAKRIIIAESSLGQLAKLVKEALYGLENSPEIIELFRPGVGITNEEIIEKTKSAL